MVVLLKVENQAQKAVLAKVVPAKAVRAAKVTRELIMTVQAKIPAKKQLPKLKTHPKRILLQLMLQQPMLQQLIVLLTLLPILLHTNPALIVTVM